MRVNLLACRVVVAPALGLVLALMVTACASSTPSVSPTHSPTSAPPSVSASTLITTNWETFFNGKSRREEDRAAAERANVRLRHPGSVQLKPGQVGLGPKVLKVTVTSPAQAAVTYNVLLSGTTALSNQTGTAVYQTGPWKVGDVSFCGLLALEGGGKAPSVCSSAGG